MPFRTIDPLALVPNESIEVVENDPTLTDPACVFYDARKKHHKICFNDKIIYSLYKHSLLFGKVSFFEFKLGFFYHEVFHVLFKTFSVEKTIESSFFDYVWNVLNDSQIEYNGSKYHPDSTQYVRWCLASTKRSLDLSSLSGTASGNKIIAMQKQFYYLVRFGVVLPDIEKDFLDFLLPIVLSSMRGNVENVMRASEAVFEYFYAEGGKEKQVQDGLLSKDIGMGVTREAISQEELDEIENLDEAFSSSLKETLKEATSPNIDQDGGKLAGTSTNKIEIVESDDEFYRKTVTKYRDKIEYMRREFAKLLNEIVEIEAFDGDFNLQKQQQAYLDSMTFEFGRNYITYDLREINLYHCLGRDVSGSTGNIKEQYAELTVCLHAVLQNFQGVKDAHIDFESSAVTLLKFEESIRKSRIYPVSRGGTDLLSCYQEVEKMNWRGKKNVLNIVTDGYYGSGHTELENKLKAKGIKIFKWNIDRSGDKELLQTSLETFHTDIIATLRKEIRS